MELIKEVTLSTSKPIVARGIRKVKFSSGDLDRVYLSDGYVEIHVRMGTSPQSELRIICVPVSGIVSFERYNGQPPAEALKPVELAPVQAEPIRNSVTETEEPEDYPEDEGLDLPGTGDEEENFEESPSVKGEELEGETARRLVENPQVFKKQPPGTMAAQRRASRGS